jgi:hypothetical protein
MARNKPYVGLHLTPQLESLIEDEIASQRLSEAEKLAIASEVAAGYVSQQTLKRMRDVTGNDVSFINVCKGSRLVFLNQEKVTKVRKMARTAWGDS